MVSVVKTKRGSFLFLKLYPVSDALPPAVLNTKPGSCDPSEHPIAGTQRAPRCLWKGLSRAGLYHPAARGRATKPAAGLSGDRLIATGLLPSTFLCRHLHQQLFHQGNKQTEQSWLACMLLPMATPASSMAITGFFHPKTSVSSP